MSKLQYQDLIGVPFKKDGRSKEEGFDCAGLSFEIVRRLGLPVPDSGAKFPKCTEERSLILQQQFQNHCIEIEKPESYCVVAFKTGLLVTHMGIMLEDCVHFIHIMRRYPVSIASIGENYWKRKLVGFYRYNP